MSRQAFGYDWKNGCSAETTRFSKQSVRSFVKSLKETIPLLIFLVLFVAIGAISFVLKFKILAILSVSYIIALILRMPDTKQEAMFIESIGTFGLILCLVGGPGVAAFYVFTSTWLTRFTSPMGGAEEIGDTIGMSIAFTACIFIIPFLTRFFGHDLFLLMVSYTLIRFVVYYLLMIVIMPATWFNYWISAPVVMVTVLFQSYLILWLVGLPLLNYAGVEGWVLGAFKFFR